MNSTPRVLVGVCTLNEAANIESLAAGVRNALPNADLLVVDDESSDGTADLVRQISATHPNVQLVVRSGERGLGGAILRAANESIDGGYDFFINLDADLSHDPSELPRLLELAIEDDSVDVVIGSRYVDGGRIVGWPLRRRMMSRLLNRFATLFLRLPIRDCSGSMRCYRVKKLRELDFESLKCRGYALLEELLVHLHRKGATFREYPITFTERRDGYSKLTFGEAIRSMSFMIRLAISSKRLSI